MLSARFEADKWEIGEFMAAAAIPAQHGWSLHSQPEANERAEGMLARHPGIRQFRPGHPCWRKLTGPMLFSDPNEEMVVLDPDDL